MGVSLPFKDVYYIKIFKYLQEFLDHSEKLWEDPGVQKCYERSHEFHLIDCAK